MAVQTKVNKVGFLVRQTQTEAQTMLDWPGWPVWQGACSIDRQLDFRSGFHESSDRVHIHVGQLAQALEKRGRVCVEAIGPGGLIRRESFPLRDYGEDVPVFIQRFGEAYKGEVADFVDRCITDRPFTVTQVDGLNAVLVAYAGSSALRQGAGRVPIDYTQ